MGHLVQIAAGLRGVELPDGSVLAGGAQKTLSDADYAKIPAAMIGSIVTNLSSSVADPILSSASALTQANAYTDSKLATFSSISFVGRTLTKLQTATAIKITFIADSGLEGNTATTPGTDDAATLFCADLGTRFGVTVTKSNRALSGSTSAYTLFSSWRSPVIFPAAIADAADLYVISFGHNDIRSDLATPGTGYQRAASAATIEHMIRRIRLAVPLADIILSGEWAYTDTATASNAALTPYSAQLRLLAAYYGCEYVDFAAALTSHGVGLGNATTDAIYVYPSNAPQFGQHPTSAGHRVWADALLAKFPLSSTPTTLPATVLPGSSWTTYATDTIDTDWTSVITGRSVPNGVPGWRQSGVWSPLNGAIPSTTATAGNSIVCQFDGTECFLRLDTGVGQGVATINVDGFDLYASLNLATAGSGQTRIPIIGLARGIHNVQVTVVSGSVTWRGLDCRTGSVTTIIDPSNVGITYTGAGWAAQSTSPSAWNNIVRSSTTIGDSYGFTFTGVAFGIQCIRYVSLHQVSVTVDGVTATTDISTTAPGGVISGVVVKSGLTSGSHTVSVASMGARNLYLGAIFWW